jgi:hypothetical protein
MVHGILDPWCQHYNYYDHGPKTLWLLLTPSQGYPSFMCLLQPATWLLLLRFPLLLLAALFTTGGGGVLRPHSIIVVLQFSHISTHATHSSIILLVDSWFYYYYYYYCYYCEPHQRVSDFAKSLYDVTYLVYKQYISKDRWFDIQPPYLIIISYLSVWLFPLVYPHVIGSV